jgi:hypothetical protein
MTKQTKMYAWLALLITALIIGYLSLRSCGEKSNGMILRDKENKTGARPPRPPSHAEVEARLMDAVLAVYSNPISLYGKVVDQYGDPVPGATIDLYPLTSHFKEDAAKDIVLTSDAEGEFSITGLKGFSMGVSVSKPGYLRYPPTSGIASEVTLGYSGDGGGNRHAEPSNPLIMELHKIGATEPLVRVARQRWKLPLDGTPRIIALDSKDGTGTHQIEFRFKSDTHSRREPGRSVYSSFDWSFEFSIPGGGLVWDASDAIFEAPETGYTEKVLYSYSATLPREEWKRVRYGRYFVRFPDGTHGRIQFDIDGGSDTRPLYMESWLNPKPGSRNLATETMTINKMEVEDPGE